MPTVSLTKRTLDAAKPPKSGEVLLWDDKLQGFACKVTPTGRRVFLVQYWSPVERGKRRRFTIGNLGESYRHPDGSTVHLTTHAAREIAEAVRGEVASGRDPFLERERAEKEKLARDAAGRRADSEAAEAALRAAEGRRTFAEVAAECRADWAGRLALPIGSRRRLSPKTVRERERLLAKHILPVLGARPVLEIGPADAEEMRKAMGTRRPILANRVQQLCHVIVAEARDGMPNPFSYGRGKRAQWFEERETRQPITREELGQLFAALEADDDVTRGGAHDAIRFLALTGWRKQEALSLRWDAVDLDTGDVRLQHTKTGLSERSLSPEALALLSRFPRRGPFVFPSPFGMDAPRTEAKRVWLRVRALAGISKPMHALRHGFATTALSEGIPLASVGALLGHRDPATTLRYAKLENAKRREAAAQVGAALARATAVVPLVIPINSKRA